MIFFILQSTFSFPSTFYDVVIDKQNHASSTVCKIYSLGKITPAVFKFNTFFFLSSNWSFRLHFVCMVTLLSHFQPQSVQLEASRPQGVSPLQQEYALGKHPSNFMNSLLFLKLSTTTMGFMVHVRPLKLYLSYIFKR